MRKTVAFKTVAVVVTIGLSFSLMSFLPTSATAAGYNLGLPLAGTLQANGGTAGWASTNSAAIRAAGLDPTSVGQAETSNKVTTKLNGASATISIASGTSVKIDSAVAQGTGKLRLRGQNANLSFKTSPAFFSESDMIGILPTLGFSMTTYSKTSGNKLYWGHYQVDMVSKQVTVDDKTAMTAQIDHTPLTVANDNRLNQSLLSNTMIWDQVNLASKTFAGPGTATLNEGTKRVFTEYAAAMPFGFGNIDLPFTTGYQQLGVTSNKSASVSLDTAMSGDSWLGDLASGASSVDVPVSFTGKSINWEKALSSRATAELKRAGLWTQLERAITETLNYDQLVTVIQGRTQAQLATELQPMTESIINDFAAAIDTWGERRIDEITGFPQWYGIIKMDKIIGTTDFSAGKKNQKPVEIYPNLKKDMAKQVGTLVQQRVGKQWATAAKNGLSGTLNLTTVVTDLQMTSLVPTGGQNLTGEVGLTVSPTSALTVGTAAANQRTVVASIYDGSSSANNGRGNPISGQTVTFSATGASSGQPAFSANRCTTGSNGQCQVTVTSTLAGEFTITAAAEGRLPKSATVTWKAGDAAAAKSQLTLASSTLRPGGSTQVKLFVADAYGNPVTGLTKTNAKLSVSSPLALSNDFKAVANQPGNYTMTLKVGTNAKSGVFPVKAQPGSFTLSTELTISSTASTTAAPTASKTTGTTAAPTASETPVIELDWISDLFANFISFFVGLFRIPIKIISIPIIVG